MISLSKNIFKYNNTSLDSSLCQRCRYFDTCHRKTYDTYKPETCDEWLAIHRFFEWKIDTGLIFYEYYKNKYRKEFYITG